MLNISFLACTKVIGPDNLYCGKLRKISKSHHDLDHDPTMSIIELVRDIFIYYNEFQFHVLRLITFRTRKRFLEKPIVAFANSTVFILDFYIYD